MAKQMRFAEVHCSLPGLGFPIPRIPAVSGSYAQIPDYAQVQEAVDLWNRVILTGDIDSDVKTVQLMGRNASNPITAIVFTKLHPYIHRVVFTTDHAPMEYIIDAMTIVRINFHDVVFRMGLLKIMA